MRAGTDAQFGPGAWSRGYAKNSTRIYGLAGEMMLNFGPAAIPFAFVLLGSLVGGVARFCRDLDPRDLRLLIAPLLVVLAILFLGSDSDNCVFFIVKYGTVPCCVLTVCARRQVLHTSGDAGSARCMSRSP